METIGFDLTQMKRVPLSEEHLAAIREAGTECSYAAGEIVAATGEALTRFVLVLEGEIEVKDPYSDARLLESGLGPGQFMGDINFLNGGATILPMRAAVDTRTVEVPRKEMLDLMARIPELSDHIIGVFTARRRRTFEASDSAIKVVGAERDPAVQRVASFLSRNRIPHLNFALDDDADETARLCNLSDHEPAVFVGKDEVMADPTPRKVAQMLGLDLDVTDTGDIDLLIVGGGPAGVAAAVYAGSEGLSALVVEDSAIGGQAGTSSRIENYMGFPTGISGADLTLRGQIQAMKFGTRFAMPRRVEKLERLSDRRYCATLDDGDTICAGAVLVATGVQYRRLPLDRLEEFESAGVFYAATEMEARWCRGGTAVVIGGGNSAGQAAMYLSRSADHVHVLIRGNSLADSMSDYLSSRLESDPRITIDYGTSCTALHGNTRLEAITIAGPDGVRTIDAKGLFIMIGAAPNTGWLEGHAETDERGFVKTGDAAGAANDYATSAPGIFAVGDCRAGSVKRVASAVGEGSVVVSSIWQHVRAAKEPATL